MGTASGAGRKPPPKRSDSGDVSNRFACYRRNHKVAMLFSLNKLRTSLVSTLLIIAVIGMAIALPGGLFVALKNLKSVASGWDDVAQLSLFLHSDSSMEVAEELSARLRGRGDVSRVEIVPPEAALKEFRLTSGFGEALDALGENPLPIVLVVSPALDRPDEKAVEALASELENMPEVDRAQSDLQWLRRLFGILAVMQKAALIIGLLLAGSILLVVGNTIRLEIQNRRKEIEVSKLIGAPDAYVRRPFLYGGFFYGLFGGLLAWIILLVALSHVEAPVHHLAGLYESDFRLLSLSLAEGFRLLAISAGLGLFGAWIALFWHLRDIQPR